MKLSNKTILITGGATGIGFGLAKALLKAENEVCICALTEKDLEIALAEAPDLHGYVCDISQPDSVDQMLRVMQDQGKKLDVLINNAGILSTLDLVNSPLAATALIQRDIDVCVMGMIDLTHKVLPQMYKNNGGTIINVCSPAGLVPVAQTPGYSLAKAAVHSYTQSLRYQTAEKNITVVEVFPPSVETNISKHNGRKDISADEFAAKLIAKIEKGKLEVWIGESNIVRFFAKLPSMFAFNTINKAVPIKRDKT